MLDKLTQYGTFNSVAREFVTLPTATVQTRPANMSALVSSAVAAAAGLAKISDWPLCSTPLYPAPPPSLQFKSMADRRHRTHYLRPTRPRAPCCLSSVAPLLSTAALCTLVSSAAASQFQTCGRSSLRAKVVSASEADLSTPPELGAGLRSSCCYLSSHLDRLLAKPPGIWSPQVSSTKISDVAFT